VSRNADRKAVKSAYYDLVKVLHPDRYFGKNIGTFRGKLDKCFSRLTEAHETLTDPDRRAEYDDYLQSLQDTEALERSLNQNVSIADLDALEQRLAETIPMGASLIPSSPAASTFPSSPIGAASPGPKLTNEPDSHAPVSSGRQLSEEERKKALARKLRLSQPCLRMPSQTQIPAAPTTPPPREQLAEQLRRQYEQSRRHAQQSQLASLLKDADEATAQGDPVKATNALRNAHELSPRDESIAQRLAQAQSLATTALADTYLKQAEYEDKSGRWEAAARSYERAARGRPAASTWEAAARCLLSADGDLRAASEYARRAIALEPERATSHLILGRIFMSAKMRKSAISELERARSLDPNNDTVATLLARLQHESV
jgi:curved DNA-binding protein CbpA